MRKRATVVCGMVIAAITLSAAANDCRQAVVLGSAKNVVINAEVTRVRLPISSGALKSKTELVLRNIRFDAHPGTQFHVVLERHDDPAKRVRVGTLSFYAPAKAGGVASRTFDVTAELRQLGLSTATPADDVNVVFEATTGRGGENAKATFDPESKLTIGEVELRIRTK